MKLEEINHKKILFACLDWGFGHVTRSIGIIKQLISQNNSVIIACSEEQKVLFSSYFPEIEILYLDGYNFKFSGKGNWAWDLWEQRKSFFESIRKEQDFVNDFCEKNEIDILISDHRYGFFSKSIPSIFITHQLHLPIPKVYFFVQKWHEKKMRKFNSIWVLDDEKSSFAGKLSSRIVHENLEYIGIISRFDSLNAENTKYDYLIVVSGPKPYSEHFLNEITEKIDFSEKKVAVLHPKSVQLVTKNQNWIYISAEELKNNDQLFYQSETIISRCGYSTLMDLKILNKKGILFPTKGQAEQEYLCKFHGNGKNILPLIFNPNERK
jgi:uncharacterized protein (TIGR00661 family)